MTTIELMNGSATVTARADYLLVVEHGTLSTAEEVHRYLTELEMASQRFHLRRLLIDARSETTEESASAGDARAATWRWIRTQRAFDQIAYVLRDEMTIARVNMTALSERLPIRAFTAVADGHRWVARPRGPSTSLPAPGARTAPSSVPPPPMVPRTSAPGPRPLATPPSAAGQRVTTKTRAITADDADAILGRTPTPSPPMRNTVKMPALDPAAAEAEIRRKPGR